MDRLRVLPCGCRMDITGTITHYGDYCLIARAMESLIEAGYRAVENEDGELAGIVCQGLLPLLDCTAVGYGHEEPGRNFGDIWNEARAILGEAWRVWKEFGAPHWVGEAWESLEV